MNALPIALELAAQGWPVFPCAPDKKPAISKRDGGRGFHDATRNPATIRAMFNHSNARLVGVPTGEASGFDALDLDFRHGAAGWVQTYSTILPPTRTHRTQSGGRHLLFRHAPGVRNSASRFAPGVDVRGQGGFIVMPPSPGYTVIAAADIAHWPDALLGLVLPPPEKPRPAVASGPCLPLAQAQLDRIIGAALDRVRGAPDGGKHFQLRNSALLLGGIADQAGFSDDNAIAWLLGALSASVRDWRGASATAAWGLENGRARPIAVPAAPETNAADPRRSETARVAFRLLRRGICGADLLNTLHDLNSRRADPLHANQIADTALWAARRMMERVNAK